MDLAAARQVGVSPLSPMDVEGSRGKDGYGVNLPETPSGNPGPTANLRGIEPNTSIDAPSQFGEPIITQTFGSEVPRGEVFSAPQDQLGDVEGPGDPGWQGYDSAANNSVAVDSPQVGSFTKFGEHYPANGDQDGDGDTGPDTDHDGM
jgi:hypothetical protein